MVDICYLQKRVQTELRPGSRILEAGGGKRCRFPMPKAHITVIDTDAGGLAMNTRANKKILADLEEFDFGDRMFDLIVLYDVLEHLKQPDRTLERLTKTLAPGGLIFIRGPVAASMKATATRFLPHSAHVLFYRHVLGNPKAGTPGFAPFRTEFATGASEEQLLDLLEKSEMDVVEWQRFTSAQIGMLRAKSAILYGCYIAAAKLVRLATLSRYGSLHTDFWMLARRG